MKQQLLQKFEEIECFLCKYFTDYKDIHSIKKCPRYTYKDIKKFLSEAISQTEKETRENTIKEIEKIVIDHIDYLRDNYGDIMDIELLENNVLKKVQSLIKSYKVK